MSTRDAYYDNAKYLLILLVVFGHLIQSYINENKLIFTIYTTIYLFHMPAFILISGYFAKGFKQKGYLLKITKKLIGPYLIFQAIYSLYYFVIYGKKTIEIDPFIPQWSLWFLISLFCWNVMLFLFAKWKVSFGLVISISLGIIIGYFDEINSYLSLSRTIVFFPLFLLGFYFQKEFFKKIQLIKIKIIALIFMITIFSIFYILPEFDYKWLFGSKPYEALHYTGIYGGIIRLGVYSLTILTTLCFLALVPKKQYFFTKWGTNSIYIYLLHGFFIKYFRNSELVDLLKETQQIVILIILSLLLTMILSSNIIKAITQPFIELKISTLKRYIVKLQQHKMKSINQES